MRKAILYLTLAAAWSVAAAQDQANVFVPESSIERPEDIGLRMHTNYFYELSRSEPDARCSTAWNDDRDAGIHRLHL